jgi:hypothetical protein
VTELVGVKVAVMGCVAVTVEMAVGRLKKPSAPVLNVTVTPPMGPEEKGLDGN